MISLVIGFVIRRNSFHAMHRYSVASCVCVFGRGGGGGGISINRYDEYYKNHGQMQPGRDTVGIARCT